MYMEGGWVHPLAACGVVTFRFSTGNETLTLPIAPLVQVGGGAGGTELALSMQFKLRQELQRVGKPTDNVRFTLITRGQVSGAQPV
jgi:hypothetical protein